MPRGAAAARACMMSARARGATRDDVPNFIFILHRTMALATDPAPAPTVIRIKRKREEPALPEFVLGGQAKRPASLSALSLGDGAPAPAPRARYRLISRGGGPLAAAGSPARKAAADLAASLREVSRCVL